MREAQRLAATGVIDALERRVFRVARPALSRPLLELRTGNGLVLEHIRELQPAAAARARQ
jgi:hypothetical protein